MPQLYLLHPAAIHFPIVLLTAGWSALGLGLLAEKTAPHVPPAWETLAEHEELAWWTVGLFSGLSLWRWRKPGKAERLFLVAWAAAAGVLFATAWHGGELVYKFGMGVASAP